MRDAEYNVGVKTMEHTHFRIVGMSYGWMDWQVRGPGIKEDICASWVGDTTLDPMLRLATSMLTFRKEGYFWHLNMKEWTDFVAGFPGEPECYQATFREPEGNTVEFILEKSDDDMGTGGSPYRQIGEGTVNMDEFANDLLADSVRLLREYGFVGFHEMWDHNEYPIAELLRLIAVQRNREPFCAGLEQELRDLMDVIDTNKSSEATSEPAQGTASSSPQG